MTCDDSEDFADLMSQMEGGAGGEDGDAGIA
jgi:hypothetical protein